MYLPCEPVFFREVPVKKYRFDEKLVKNNLDLQKVILRTKPLDFLGFEYENILMPALPCLDLEFSGPAEDAIGFFKQQEGLPALASGKRSALIVEENSCLRLKGCGNQNLGFNKQNMVFPEGFFEIRGCCFENTVFREQFMTFLINEVIKDAGFFTGNFPVEVWKYQEPGFELIEKFCGVFQTFGEKRLGSHLIVGIERLVSMFFLGIVGENVKELIPDQRKMDFCTVRIIRQNGPLNEPLDQWTRKGVYLDNSLLVNVLENENGFLFVEDEKVTVDGKTFESRDLINKVAQVCYRIGWEVGVIKRVLQDSGISWGYFIDHNPFEPHCNAHCNNFIILGPNNQNLLAPVDFDMSFRREEFISLMEGETFGKQDLELFENWVNCERLNLELTLAGQENMANFLYSTKGSSIQDENLKVLQFLLKDLMVLGFRSGFERHDFPFEWNRNCYEDVIRESLKMTNDVSEY